MRSERRLLVLLLGYGVLNAILYAGLLPLWDGFDEPFHYAYVSRIWRERQWQNYGTASVPAEVADSLPLAPASHLVKRNIPSVVAFNEYFAMSAEQRSDLRRRLESIDPRRAEIGVGMNYESQQAPLAYLVLAPFDMWWRNVPLVSRVLRLRIVCGLAAAISLGLLVWRLGGQLGLDGTPRLSAVFLALSSQIFYAATAHVANDWLGIPLFTALIVCALELDARPTRRSALVFSAVLSAGLLTKAYFLAVVPFAAGMLGVLWLRRRLPAPALLAGAIPMLPAILWYGRNYSLYGDLSGVQQTVGGIPGRSLLAALTSMPWIASVRSSALTSLWFGNSSATRFSARTLYVLLFLMVVAAILYAASAVRRGWPRPERIVAAALAAYSMGLVYSAVLHFVTTHGVMDFAAPWYTHPLYPPALCLLMLGAMRFGRPGEVVRVSMLAGWAYLIIATYVLKLIPFYAGYPAPTVHAGELLRWYRAGDANSVLSTICLLPAPAIWTLTAAVVAGAVVCAAGAATIRVPHERAFEVPARR